MGEVEAGGIRRGGRGRFKKGQSGNPAGRPKGSRNRTSGLCADLLGDVAGEIMAKLIVLAKKGEPVALKLCVDRMLPVRAARDRVVEVDIAAVESAQDLVQAASVVIERCAAGEMTLSEGKEFMALLEVQRRSIETADLAVRIEALETAGARPGGFDVDPDAAARVRSILRVHLEREPKV